MLLATKFFIPQPQQTLVARPRLSDQLDAGLAGKLILVSAPAGFGKSTLISQWILDLGDSLSAASKIQNPKSTWLSLDEADNDPMRFFSYLVAALQRVDTTLGRAVQELLLAPQPLPPASLLTMLINDLTRIDQPFVLVLDDYHLITTPAIHEAVTFLVEQMPPSLKLVIATRADPPLPLSRWRVRRVVTEIRERDLRFTPAEAAAFLQTELGVALSPNDLTALEERTEGWIAGLQLAALSLRGHEDVSGFIRQFTGSHAYVIDYLTEEVLQRQPEPLQRFLLQTAILERLCGPLCNALTGGSDGQQILEHLQRANLFLTPLDDQRTWYRYHPLFTEVLRLRLEQHNASLVPTLHERARLWYASHGQVGEAIHHALAAGNFTQAADLIEAHAGHWRNQGEFVTLTHALDRLPVEVVRSRPKLCLERAEAQMFYHHLDQAVTWLDAAEAASQALGEADPLLQGKIGLVRTDVALNRGLVGEAIRLGEAALQQLPAHATHPRSHLLFLLGVAYFWQAQNDAAKTQHYARAQAAYQAAIELALSAGAVYTAVYCQAALAELFQHLGRWQQTYAALQQNFVYAQQQGVAELPVLASTYVIMGETLYELNDLAGAAGYYTTSLRLAQLARNPRTELHVYTSWLRLAAAQGQTEQVQMLLLQAEQLLAQFSLPPAMVNDFLLTKWQLALRTGDSDPVAAWFAVQASKITTDRYHPDLVRARLYLVQGQLEAALALLQQLVDAALAGQELPYAVEALALISLTQAQTGHRTTALGTLEQLLILAEPEGFIRTLVDEGEAMRFLILEFRSWIAERSSRDVTLRRRLNLYTDKLLAAFPDPAAPPTTPHSSQHLKSVRSTVETANIHHLLDRLSDRELEVLRLADAGLSNSEIAERLIIVPGTVKRHIHSIFGKLRVTSRTQALARARALGLLE